MDPIDIIVNSINNNTNQVNQLSHNIANANTPGFVGKQVFSIHNGQAGSQVESVHNKNLSSAFQITNRPLDLAVTDQSFLVVGEQDSMSLTRNGRLHINQEGVLSHFSGASVMGQNGTIVLPAGAIEISPKGAIFVDGEQLDQLLTVELKADATLTAQGNSLFSVTGQVQPSAPQIKQGAINGASVSVSQDMVRLIELSRHTQSLQKAVLAIDQISNAGINELGKRQ